MSGGEGGHGRVGGGVEGGHRTGLLDGALQQVPVEEAEQHQGRVRDRPVGQAGRPHGGGRSLQRGDGHG